MNGLSPSILLSSFRLFPIMGQLEGRETIGKVKNHITCRSKQQTLSIFSNPDSRA